MVLGAYQVNIPTSFLLSTVYGYILAGVRRGLIVYNHRAGNLQVG
jgi:hypothetical protein